MKGSKAGEEKNEARDRRAEAEVSAELLRQKSNSEEDVAIDSGVARRRRRRKRRNPGRGKKGCMGQRVLQEMVYVEAFINIRAACLEAPAASTSNGGGGGGVYSESCIIIYKGHPTSLKGNMSRLET